MEHHHFNSPLHSRLPVEEEEHHELSHEKSEESNTYWYSPTDLLKVQIDIDRNLRSNRKAVAFAPSALVAATPSVVGPLSAEEINACWYSPTDLLKIQVDIDRTLRLMETHLPIDEETQCTRGLERSTEAVKETSRKERAEIVQAVVRDHYMERRYGHTGGSSVAAKYGQRCAQDKEAAHLLGMVDEDEALKIIVLDPAAAKLFVPSLRNVSSKGDMDDSESGWDSESWSLFTEELHSVMEEEDIEDDHHHALSPRSVMPVSSGASARKL